MRHEQKFSFVFLTFVKSFLCTYIYENVDDVFPKEPQTDYRQCYSFAKQKHKLDIVLHFR